MDREYAAGSCRRLLVLLRAVHLFHERLDADPTVQPRNSADLHLCAVSTDLAPCA
jgi:hypothetical protein